MAPPATRAVWSEGVFLLLKDESDRTHDAPILGSRAPLDVGSAPMRSRRRYQRDADELRARASGSVRLGDGGASVVTAGAGIRSHPVRGRGVDWGRVPEVAPR